jgi:hypothetical protein
METPAILAVIYGLIPAFSCLFGSAFLFIPLLDHASFHKDNSILKIAASITHFPSQNPGVMSFG